MEGGGFYNRNSGLQSANLTSALPLLEEAAAAIPLAGEGALVIVDYGCSEGRNSMRPMSAAIDALRARTGDTRAIEVVHTDLPTNDFTSLFTTLSESTDSYLTTHDNVFASAVGLSYFRPIRPPASVDLGWSSNALHWLSRNPVDVPDHGWAIFSASEAAREAVERLLAEDWQDFLRARAIELRPGGRLVCQFMSRGPESHGFEWMSGCFWQTIADMAADGLLTTDELLHMTCPSAGRSIAQLEAPFADGSFAGVVLDRITLVEAPDPFWQRYEQSGDAEELGRSWANTMRAANGPNFAAALDPARDSAMLFDELTSRLAARVAATPQRSRSYNVLLVLRKL
jgi:cyclopropane-fatty-acyl-phospholipid synthase